MNTREDIVRRIKALQDRTVDRGCSEAEALSAARVAARLLAEHGLSMSDIEIKERVDCERGDILTGRKRAHEIQYCMLAIAKFCDCKVWKNSGNYSLYGFPEDVSTAKWLYNLVLMAMNTEIASFKIQTHQTGKRESHAFLLGMANRVSQRLNQMKREQEQETTKTTGRELMVVKSQVVEKQFKTVGITLSKNYSRTNAGNYGAYNAGQQAGDRVNFNRSVGQQRYIR